jgi:hypothetical protein
MKKNILICNSMNRLSLVMVIISFQCSNTLATEQVMDEIIYKDTTFYIFSSNLHEPIRDYPLEAFIEKMSRDSIGRSNINSMLKCYRWCLRGYVAKWEVRNDSLLLRKIVYGPPTIAFIEGNYSADDSFPLGKLFPNRDNEGGVLAEWFTGVIRAVSEESNYPLFRDEYWKGKRKAIYVEKGLVKVCRSS